MLSYKISLVWAGFEYRNVCVGGREKIIKTVVPKVAMEGFIQVKLVNFPQEKQIKQSVQHITSFICQS